MKRFLYLLFVSAFIFSCSSPLEPVGPNNGSDNQEVVATTIKLNKNQLSLEKGKSETLTVSLTPTDVTNKTIKWVSSNTSVATVNEGVVTGVSAGSAEITAQCGTVTDKCLVDIFVPTSGIKLNKNELTLEKGASEVLTVSFTPDDASNKELSWSSSNTDVVTVSDGKVTAVSFGTADIIVKCGDLSDKCVVTVAGAVTSFWLNTYSVTLAKGKTFTLEATFEPSGSYAEITWVSSDESVATVNNGVITAVGRGEAVITAKVGTLEASCDVNVVIIPTSVSINETEVNLIVGETKQLSFTVTPSDAALSIDGYSSVYWSCYNDNYSDPKIATVNNNNNVVTGVAYGKGTLTVKIGNYYGDEWVEVVSEACPISVDLPSNPPSGSVDMGTVVRGSDRVYYRVYWSTKNLGANNPEDYGDYYAWGETTSRSNKYTRENYKWYTAESRDIPQYQDGSYNWFTKYNEVDDKQVLDWGDDAASVKLGGKWRMPTNSELYALGLKRANSNYKWEWTSKNGHSGWEITYLKTGASIFLPAAGRKYDSSSTEQSGSMGFYWSSQRPGGAPYGRAYSLFFEKDVFKPGINNGVMYEYFSGRSLGFTIRPVITE